jgi:hypothetical protein
MGECTDSTGEKLADLLETIDSVEAGWASPTDRRLLRGAMAEPRRSRINTRWVR